MSLQPFSGMFEVDITAVFQVAVLVLWTKSTSSYSTTLANELQHNTKKQFSKELKNINNECRE